MEFHGLYSKFLLATYFIDCSMYLLILISQFILPSLSFFGWHLQFWVVMFLNCHLSDRFLMIRLGLRVFKKIIKIKYHPSHYIAGVVQLLSCVRLCDPMDCSTPGSPVLHHLLKFAQTHVHGVDDVIQPSHPLLSPFPPALNLFQWVSSLHQVAKILATLY